MHVRKDFFSQIVSYDPSCKICIYLDNTFFLLRSLQQPNVVISHFFIALYMTFFVNPYAADG